MGLIRDILDVGDKIYVCRQGGRTPIEEAEITRLIDEQTAEAVLLKEQESTGYALKITREGYFGGLTAVKPDLAWFHGRGAAQAYVGPAKTYNSEDVGQYRLPYVD